MSFCGPNLTRQQLADRWFAEYRQKFHDGIWNAHHDELNYLQARGVDIIVTTLPDIGRGDFMNRLIPFVTPTDSRTRAQIVHEEMEPIILGPYISTRS
jgi:hypothetical protein